MRAKELLTERVLNLFHADEKIKYADQVWDLLQKSYQKAGGFHSAEDIPELISKTNLWKLVVRNGQVTAANLYKDLHGRKSIAAGTDGTLQGKNDYKMVKSADIKYRRAWSEVSGAPEHLAAKSGLRPLPAKFASMLTGKEITEFNPDGYHYTRLISGEPHEKVIYGSIELTPDTILKLTQAGFDLHELPEHFRKI